MSGYTIGIVTGLYALTALDMLFIRKASGMKKSLIWNLNRRHLQQLPAIAVGRSERVALFFCLHGRVRTSLGTSLHYEEGDQLEIPDRKAQQTRIFSSLTVFGRFCALSKSQSSSLDRSKARRCS